jgi:hypothetical protein
VNKAIFFSFEFSTLFLSPSLTPSTRPDSNFPLSFKKEGREEGLSPSPATFLEEGKGEEESKVEEEGPTKDKTKQPIKGVKSSIESIKRGLFWFFAIFYF